MCTGHSKDQELVKVRHLERDVLGIYRALIVFGYLLLVLVTTLSLYLVFEPNSATTSIYLILLLGSLVAILAYDSLLRRANVARELLKESYDLQGERSRVILSQAVDGIVTIDSHGIIDSFNPACERIFGYRSFEVVGKNVSILMDEPNRSLHDSYLRKYLNTKEPKVLGTSREVTAKRKNGELFPMDLAMGSFEINRETYFCGIVRDITKRKVAEESSALLSSIVQHSDDGIVSLSLEGIITSWNKGAERLLSYKEDEIVGRHISSIIPPELVSEEEAKLEKIRNHEPVESYETVRLNKIGTKVNISLSVAPLENSKGELIGFCTINRDINRRKLAQLELQKYMKDLEASNLELDEFAYLASHDLKEPVRGICNHASWLLRDFRETLAPKALSRVERIAFLSQRTAALIDDLLNYSRLAHAELELKETDLNELVTDVSNMLLAAREGDVTIQIPKPLPIIRCDGVSVRELFRNLFTNGIKYNDQVHKAIEVGVREDETSQSATTFFVKDNGIGIDESFHSEIFRIFKRLHKPEAYGEGTGSGLSFVKRIVERHGGRIWVESAVGSGSKFYFTLGPDERR